MSDRGTGTNEPPAAFASVLSGDCDSVGRLTAHVEAMTGCGSRYWGGPGFLSALEYAENQLASWGVRTRRMPYTIEAPRNGICWNLIADSDRSQTAGEYRILIGAHLDSIAPGAADGGPAPGADDNASGCAVLLEAARRLAHTEIGAVTRFVLFGAEEIGMKGSGAYVSSLTREERKALRSVWILDQVGLHTRSHPTIKLEGKPRRSEVLMRKAEAAAREAGLETTRALHPYGSDHMPFLDAGMPALLLIQPDDEDDPLNHTENDTPERLSFGYMSLVLDLVVRVVDWEGSEILTLPR